MRPAKGTAHASITCHLACHNFIAGFRVEYGNSGAGMQRGAFSLRRKRTSPRPSPCRAGHGTIPELPHVAKSGISSSLTTPSTRLLCCPKALFDRLFFISSHPESPGFNGQLMCYHIDFWKPMDTLRDKRELEALWASGSPPWKRW